MPTNDDNWTRAEIDRMAQIETSDVLKALSLIREASPELFEMIQAEEHDVLVQTKETL